MGSSHFAGNKFRGRGIPPLGRKQVAEEEAEEAPPHLCSEELKVSQELPISGHLFVCARVYRPVVIEC